MATTEKKFITVTTKINAPVEKVWDLWTDPKHIIRWNYALDHWHTPIAENDLCIGGKFLFRMESKDGSRGFDFKGKYNEIERYESIDYTIDYGRRVRIIFEDIGTGIKITEEFEDENVFTSEMRRTVRQAILDNFKKYAENVA